MGHGMLPTVVKVPPFQNDESEKNKHMGAESQTPQMKKREEDANKLLIYSLHILLKCRVILSE